MASSIKPFELAIFRNEVQKFFRGDPPERALEPEATPEPLGAEPITAPGRRLFSPSAVLESSASTQEAGMKTPQVDQTLVAAPERAQQSTQDQEIRQTVIDALEHPMYSWRTVPAMAADLGLEIETVERILRELSTAKPRILVRSSRRSTAGEALYTTVRHYKEKIPFGRRVAAAFQNRIA